MAGVVHFGNEQIYTKEAVDKVIEEEVVGVFDEMPAPDESNAGRVVQYTGESGNGFTQGYFYKSDGDSWTEIGVSAVVVKVDELPAWANARSDVLYFDKTNLVCKLKNPGVENDWYTIGGNGGGESSAGIFIVNELPAWADARANVLYFVKPDGKTYVKDSVEGFNLVSEPSPEIPEIPEIPEQKNQVVTVSELPEWEDAEEDTLYFVKPEGKAYVKDSVDGFNLVSEPSPQIPGTPEVTVDGQSVPVDELVFQAFTDAQINEAFES